MSHIWNYLILGCTAFVSICVAISATHARKRDRQHAAADHNLEIEIAKAEAKKEAEKVAEKELQHAYGEISNLEQKLSDTNRHLAQQQYTSANLSYQVETEKAGARKEFEHELQLSYAKISNLEHKLNSAYDRIEKLKNELESALIHTPKYSVPATPQLTPTPRMTLFYKTHYPKTWGYIENNTIYPDSYVSIYNYYWGELQKRHGDGIVFDTLTEQEQSYVRYLPFGDYVFLSDIKSDTYHINPNCYSLLKTPYLTVDAIHANGRKRCTKCVPSNK